MRNVADASLFVAVDIRRGEPVALTASSAWLGFGDPALASAMLCNSQKLLIRRKFRRAVFRPLSTLFPHVDLGFVKQRNTAPLTA